MTLTHTFICSNPLSPEGGVILGGQEGLYRVHPGAANVRMIGHLTGNAEQSGGIWGTGFRQTDLEQTFYFKSHLRLQKSKLR